MLYRSTSGLQTVLKKAFLSAERRRKRLRHNGESSNCKPRSVSLRPSVLLSRRRPNARSRKDTALGASCVETVSGALVSMSRIMRNLSTAQILKLREAARRSVRSSSPSWKGFRIKPEICEACNVAVIFSWLYALVRITLISSRVCAVSAMT